MTSVKHAISELIFVEYTSLDTSTDSWSLGFAYQLLQTLSGENKLRDKNSRMLYRPAGDTGCQVFRTEYPQLVYRNNQHGSDKCLSPRDPDNLFYFNMERDTLTK